MRHQTLLQGYAGGFILLCSSATAFADISGKVFLDYNLNGQLDNTAKIRNFADNLDINIAVDKGIAGAQVRAECITNSGTTTFGPVTTDASGQFTLTTTGATAGANNCVLQLAYIPSGYSVGTQNGNGNVLTQFVTPNTTSANFAVKEASSYCQNNPDLATSRYAYGQQTPNPPYAGNNDVANLFAFPYNSGSVATHQTTPTGYNAPDMDANDPTIKNLALAKEVGSVFGLGWHPASKSLFAAAYMKTWTGFGSHGTGAIYRVNLNDPATPTTSLYADINTLFPATPPTAGADPFVTGIFSPASPGYVQISDGSNGTDPDGAYIASGNTTRDEQSGDLINAVWKTAFGDLDVTADGKSIVTVNLANRSLYFLPVQDNPLTAADAAKVEHYAIPFDNACLADGLGYFDKQAFGLGEYQGDIYVGTRCDTGWGVPLTEVRRFDRSNKTFAPAPSLHYLYVSDQDVYERHLLIPSDIVFDPTGNMTIAYRQTGADTGKGAGYGAVRRACVQDVANRLWSMESNGSCGGITTAGAGNNKGPNGGQYFFQEWPSDMGATYWMAGFGGATHVPGFQESAYTIADPFQVYESGVTWLDVGLGDVATAGQRKRAYSFYRGKGSFEYPDNRPVSGKNGALGDLEVLCEQPSIEIGNRVWQDGNNNGIQDAGEAPIAGVKVELFTQGVDVNSATPLATTLTDADGYYVFSNDPRGYPTSGNNAPNDTVGANGGFNIADIQGGRASTASHKYGLNTLLPNTQYQIAIRNVTGAGKQAALTTLALTTPSQGTDEERNSDGGLVGTNAISNVTTLDSGNHYHAVDFGFVASNTPTCSINTPTVTSTCNNNGTPSNASDDKFTYKITATGSNVGATYSISGGDTYANRSYGTEHTSTNSFPISGGNLALTLTDDTTASCKLENVTITVPSTCSSSAPSADLEVTKTANVSSAKSGDTVIYTVKVKNNGPDTATGVEVTDQLPAGVTYASHNAGQGAYTSGTGLWTVGTLANGATATLTMSVTIK